MIRAIIIASLTTLLIAVLYLPAAFAPERFLAQIRAEHGLQARLWGDVRADRILQRTLEASVLLRRFDPIPSADAAVQSDRIGQVVAQEMQRVNQRFFDNAYLRSIDALILLGTYRIQALAPWLPLEGLFAAAMLADGLFIRTRRAREFRSHDPEWFTLHASLLVLLVSASILASIIPMTLSPVLLGVVIPLSSVLVGRILANFHSSV